MEEDKEQKNIPCSQNCKHHYTDNDVKGIETMWRFLTLNIGLICLTVMTCTRMKNS